MNPPSLSLRSYLETLEEICRPLDRHALRQCILALAKQVRPEDRRVFLQNFRAILPENDHRDAAVAMIEETFLLNEIESIRKEVENRLKSVEEISSRGDSEDKGCRSWPAAERKKILH